MGASKKRNAARGQARTCSQNMLQYLKNPHAILEFADFSSCLALDPAVSGFFVWENHDSSVIYSGNLERVIDVALLADKIEQRLRN